MTTDALFARGPRITFARVITDSLAYHAYTVQDDGDGGVRLEWHGRVIEALTAVVAVEDVSWWRVEGTRPDGRRVVWRVSRLSCGCQHSAPVPATAQEILPQPEIAEKT